MDRYKKLSKRFKKPMVFDFREMHDEIEKILDDDGNMTMEHVRDKMNSCLKFQNQLRGLQYFCALVLINRATRLLKEHRFFPRYTPYMDRLSHAYLAIDDIGYLNMLKTQEHIPQYPSIYLFGLTWGLFEGTITVGNAHMIKLGKAWINHSEKSENLPRHLSYSFDACEVTKDEEEVPPSNSDLAFRWIFRLSQSVKMIDSYIESADMYKSPNDLDKRLIYLKNKIQQVKSLHTDYIQEHPEEVLKQKFHILDCARATHLAVVIDEMEEACRYSCESE